MAAKNGAGSARALIPARATLGSLRDAAVACQACDLWRASTQTVFGEGAAGARVMLVGEQPGDREDLSGRPFVGPAGRVLDEALLAAGIDRADTYVTNAVKHFKWTAAGKRRIHKKPSAAEVAACRPWLDAELEAVAPEVVVCLGATAAQALLGPQFRLTRQRGQFFEGLVGPTLTATVHPSSILRVPEESRDVELDAFVRDLTLVARKLG